MVVTLDNYKKNKRVKIRKSSRYYGQSPNSIGTIDYHSLVYTHGLNYIRVKFDSGYSNNYRISGEKLDLEFVGNVCESLYELWT